MGRHVNKTLWRGVNRSIVDSIAMFHELRKLGIRAHSWV